MNATPRLLVLETSGKVGWAALAEGSAVLSTRLLDETRRHARDLAPAVAALLRERGWRPADLDAVVVGRGPGSYTGLRVGLMSAKTLAYATGRALVVVDTFAAIARQAPASVSRLDVLADAQQEKVYYQPFSRSGDDWSASAELVILPFAEWQAGRATDAWASGPGLHRWSASVPAGERLLEVDAWDPRPESLLAVGLARYRAGIRDDPFAAEPLYLRPSSAEEQWRRRAAAES